MNNKHSQGLMKQNPLTGVFRADCRQYTVAHSAGSLREALSRAKAAAASPAAAAVSVATAGGASAADSESRQLIPSTSPALDGGDGSGAAPGPDDVGGDAGPDDANLALRLGELVAARRLPVLLIHGLYDR